MPIEWVGESLSSNYAPGDTRAVDPLAKGPPNREENTPNNPRKGSSSNPYQDSIKNRPQRFERAVFAREIMQTRMATVTMEQPLSAVIDLVLGHHMMHVPVVNKGNKLAGMISYVKLLELTVKQGDISTVTSSDAMDTRVLTATGNTTLHELSRVMVMEAVEAVPILDMSHKLIGLVTTTEMMQCIVHHSKLNVWI